MPSHLQWNPFRETCWESVVYWREKKWRNSYGFSLSLSYGLSLSLSLFSVDYDLFVIGEWGKRRWCLLVKRNLVAERQSISLSPGSLLIVDHYGLLWIRIKRITLTWGRWDMVKRITSWKRDVWTSLHSHSAVVVLAVTGWRSRSLPSPSP